MLNFELFEPPFQSDWHRSSRPFGQQHTISKGSWIACDWVQPGLQEPMKAAKESANFHPSWQSGYWQLTTYWHVWLTGYVLVCIATFTLYSGHRARRNFWIKNSLASVSCQYPDWKFPSNWMSAIKFHCSKFGVDVHSSTNQHKAYSLACMTHRICFSLYCYIQRDGDLQSFFLCRSSLLLKGLKHWKLRYATFYVLNQNWNGSSDLDLYSKTK